MGTLYLLQAGDTDRYKIGRTAVAAADRVSGLSTGSAVPLVLVQQWEIPDGVSAFETQIHAVFASRRLHDSDATEFFKFNPATINQLCDQITLRCIDFNADRVRTAEVSALEQTSDDNVDADPELTAWVADYRLLRSKAKVLDARMHKLGLQIKERIGTRAGVASKSQGRSRPMVSWKTQRKPRFDLLRFKTEHPELVAQYQTLTVSRPFVVTE